MENTEIQKRGVLTTIVQDRATALLGRQIDVTELRLMPYIQYTMVNSQKLEPHKINQEGRLILAMWGGRAISRAGPVG